jgi:hypothetical protein
MFKVVYLPTSEEVKLIEFRGERTEYNLKQYIQRNDAVKSKDDFIRFFTYDELLLCDFKPPGKIVPKYLFEVIEVT